MRKTDKLNGKQRKAIKEFERKTGFEFIHVDEINSGQKSFAEAWNSNAQWMQDWAYEAVNHINLDGCGMLSKV